MLLLWKAKIGIRAAAFWAGARLPWAQDWRKRMGPAECFDHVRDEDIKRSSHWM